MNPPGEPKANDAKDRLDRVLELVRRHVPDLELVDRQQVRWVRWVGAFLHPFVPDFSTGYTTVVGHRVLLPRAAGEMSRNALAATLAHELVHQLDQRRWGPLFYLSYGLALPTGRTMRAWWERRAYAVDLLIAREQGGEAAVVRTCNRLVELFAGRGYLWMWAGRDAARAYLDPVVQAVLSGDLDEQAPYRDILAAWRGAEAITIR